MKHALNASLHAWNWVAFDSSGAWYFSLSLSAYMHTHTLSLSLSLSIALFPPPPPPSVCVYVRACVCETRKREREREREREKGREGERGMTIQVPADLSGTKRELAANFQRMLKAVDSAPITRKQMLKASTLSTSSSMQTTHALSALDQPGASSYCRQ